MQFYKYLFGVLLFTSLASTAQAFPGGDGTTSDPYQITNCGWLQSMEFDLDAHYILMNHIECGELNPDHPEFDDEDQWSGGRGFRPVGSSTEPFTGSLNGQNFEIRNLFIERADDLSSVNPADEQYVGLFGYADGATFSNMRFTNAYVKGYRYVGALVGFQVGGSINNVQVNAALMSVDVVFGSPNRCDPLACIWARWGEYGGGIAGRIFESNVTNVVVGGAVKGSGEVIGGIVGWSSDSTVTNATSTARVDGGFQVGGVFGYLDGGTTTNAVATGEVYGYGDDGKPGNQIGGLAGYIDNATVNNSRASGQVTGEQMVGGFAGRIDSSTISDSYSEGDTAGFNNVGGFAGSVLLSGLTNTHAAGEVTGNNVVGGYAGFSGCSSVITRSYATGDVTGERYVGGFSGEDSCEGPGSTMDQVYATGKVTGGEEFTGGFIGSAHDTTISNAYANGDVSGDLRVGGFAGQFSNGTLTNGYARGLVTSTGTPGGLIGSVSDSDIINSFWDTETSGTENSDDGQGRTTVQMKTLSNFTDAGWNFTTIWGINPAQNSGYPFFRFQGFAHVDPSSQSTPAASSRRSGGGNVQRQVSTLIQTGQIEAATEVMNQWSHLFNPAPAGTPAERLESLRRSLSDLLELYRQVTGSDFTVGGGPVSPFPLPTVTVGGGQGSAGRDLMRGMSGDDVKDLQNFLISQGHPIEAGPTGFFGPQTVAALAAYQAKHGITPAQGYFGPATRAFIANTGRPDLWW